MDNKEIKVTEEKTVENNQVQEVKTDKKDNKWDKIAILAALIILLAVGLGYYTQKDSIDTPKNELDISEDHDATDEALRQKSKEEILAELNRQVADGMINISMNMNPSFENSRSKGNLLIHNSETNKYPQIVEIILDETGETIYKSGLIKVGKRINEAKLGAELPAGEYACTAYFNAVNEESKEIVGKAAAKIVITINK